MTTIQLPTDFKEFLKLLNVHQVEYLLVSGYAVAYHGYPRATADMDIWVSTLSKIPGSIFAALKEFGFDVEGLKPELFQKKIKWLEWVWHLCELKYSPRFQAFVSLTAIHPEKS